MKVLCNLETKKIIGFSKWDEIPYDPEFYIVLNVTDAPNIELDRLNDTNNDIRAITQEEIDIDIAVKLDEEADIEVSLNSTAKAFALVVLDEINALRVNAGLTERTIAQLKTAVKAKL